MTQTDPQSPPVLMVASDALSRYGFGDGHPFGPDRQEAFLREMRRSPAYLQLRIVDPRVAERDELESFHRREYVDLVVQKSAAGRGYLDAGDTPASKGIFEASSLVVGGTLLAVEEIMGGRARRGFIPIAGLHHASRAHAAGFCVFNDCGIAIELLRKRHGLRRIAYVDIDAHHGDGVFYAFESDPGRAVRRHPRGRALPVSGHRRRGGDRQGRRGRHQAQPAVPPGAGDEDFHREWLKIEEYLRRRSRSSSCSSAVPTAWKAIPSRISRSARKRTHTRRRPCAASPMNRATVACSAMGGGGYNRQNLARAWTRVVEALQSPAETAQGGRGRADIGYNCVSPTVESTCFPPA